MKEETTPRLERSSRRRILILLAVLNLLSPFTAPVEAGARSARRRVESRVGDRLKGYVVRRGTELGRKAGDAGINILLEKLSHRNIEIRLKERLNEVLNKRAQLDFELAGISQDHLFRVASALQDLISYASENDLYLLKELVGDYVPTDKTDIDDDQKALAETLLGDFVDRRKAAMEDKEKLYRRLIGHNARHNDGQQTSDFLTRTAKPKETELAAVERELALLQEEIKLGQDELAFAIAGEIWRVGVQTRRGLSR